MAQAEGYAAKIISETEALLAKVQGDLQQRSQFFRDAGIDPAKIAPALEQYMGPKEKEELARLLRADQEAIQREVDEAAARARFAAPPATGGARKPRSMV
ncbi:MAG TPA: hypothetical protein VFE82_18685 [Ramlibacter sp.]|jgi:DNA-binding transcriptional MerR regulator|uniref:hypothetical protein n=1 Tax=Ramlibacter sp. TaxID=1917967 RepID=UPI002D2C9AD2|nr:hypothetical protein [Ramlibacter sp.]HZY20503.1 hypothetical protein [Ramlibacter sp.]